MAAEQIGTFLRRLKRGMAADTLAEQSDQGLVERLIRGPDEAAFEALVRRHGPMVYRVCWRVLQQAEDSEDAFQATFLILAKKLTSVKKRDSLASWLHGIAHRVALDAKRRAGRRRKRESHVEARPEIPPDDITWKELRTVLDTELATLPEKHRAPLILFYLEGRTQDEAARQLGWSKSTLLRRLEEARAALRHRLTRKGFIWPAAISGLLISDCIVPAALPSKLIGSTVEAAVEAAVYSLVGQATARLVSKKVTALAEGVMKAMVIHKLNSVVPAFVLAGAVLTGGWVLIAAQAPQDSQKPAANSGATIVKSPAPADQPALDKPVTADKHAKVVVSGRILDPDGKPAGGAKISVCFPNSLPWLATAADGEVDKPLHAVADAAGRFAVTISRSQLDMGVKVVATAAGTGLDWIDVSADDADKALTLRLRADNVTVGGRLLDLERRPIAGASIEVESLERPADGGDLKAWIASRDAQVRGKGLSNLRPSMKTLRVAGVAGLSVSTTTDKEGRFRLAGFGSESVVLLGVRGEGIEHTFMEVCTRNDKAAFIPGARSYPAHFELLVGPGKVVTGTVTEKGTGKPIVGAAVSVDSAEGRTDDKGRYRLTGVGKRDSHYAFARGPRHFIQIRNNVPDSPGAQPITVDFELQPGREISGRLTDKDGRPVRGFVWYSARPDNPYLKDIEAPPPAMGVGAGRMTMADGAFRLLGIPGPGYLAVKAEQDRYTCAEFKEYKSNDGRIPLNIPGWKGDLVPATPFNLVPSHCHAIVAVEPSPDDAKSWTRNIILDPGKTVKGTLIGPDGKPVAGAMAFGLTSIMTTQPWNNDRPERITRLKEAEFTAFGVNVREPRTLVFVHPDKNLGKLLTVRGDEKGPLQVRLEPLGTVTGRLVDHGGNPAASITVFPSIDLRRIDRKIRRELPGDLLYFAGSDLFFVNDPRPYPASVMTDAQGQFKVAGLLPGIKYVLHDLPEAPMGGVYVKQLASVSLEAGQTTKNLGEIKLTRVPDR